MKLRHGNFFSFEVFQSLFEKCCLWNYPSHDTGVTYFPIEIHFDILLVWNTTAVIPVFFWCLVFLGLKRKGWWKLFLSQSLMESIILFCPKFNKYHIRSTEAIISLQDITNKNKNKLVSVSPGGSGASNGTSDGASFHALVKALTPEVFASLLHACECKNFKIIFLHK